jgi:hypothetical protein
LFLVHRFLSPWWRRRQVPPKRRFLQEPHGVTTQKTPFFLQVGTCSDVLEYMSLPDSTALSHAVTILGIKLLQNTCVKGCKDSLRSFQYCAVKDCSKKLCCSKRTSGELRYFYSKNTLCYFCLKKPVLDREAKMSSTAHMVHSQHTDFVTWEYSRKG